jgi:molybdenum-dependent DNA-binding transcriptional regulator ModE
MNELIPSQGSIADHLRLKQLRLSIVLDGRGSLHKAAEQIAISQSGATKALREVESLLGIPLFEREPKGLMAVLLALFSSLIDYRERGLA